MHQYDRDVLLHIRDTMSECDVQPNFVLMILCYPVKTGSQTSRPTPVVSASVNGVDEAEPC